MAQLIGFEHVYAAEVEHKVGPYHFVEQARQRVGEQGQVFGVAEAVGQG